MGNAFPNFGYWYFPAIFNIMVIFILLQLMGIDISHYWVDNNFDAVISLIVFIKRLNLVGNAFSNIGYWYIPAISISW